MQICATHTKDMFLPRVFGLLNRSIISATLTKPTHYHNVMKALMLPTVNSSPMIASGGVVPDHQVIQIRTFKDKEVLKHRCSACYFKKVDDRWWNLCSKHPRHKQRQKVEDPRMNWIVTHITRTGSYKKKHYQYENQDI